MKDKSKFKNEELDLNDSKKNLDDDSKGKIDKPDINNLKENLGKSLMTKMNQFDITLSFSSIKSLKEGWVFNFSDKGLKYFEKSIKCPKIGILGNKKAGKSLIL